MESNGLKILQEALPRIEPGDERSFEMQAIFQLTGLVTTLFIALITGSFTGEPMKIQFFEYFYNLINTIESVK